MTLQREVLSRISYETQRGRRALPSSCDTRSRKQQQGHEDWYSRHEVEEANHCWPNRLASRPLDTATQESLYHLPSSKSRDIKRIEPGGSS